MMWSRHQTGVLSLAAFGVGDGRTGRLNSFLGDCGVTLH